MLYGRGHAGAPQTPDGEYPRRSDGPIRARPYRAHRAIGLRIRRRSQESDTTLADGLEVKYGKLGGEVSLRTYERLMLDFRDRVATYRSLLRLVETNSFKDRYNNASEDERKEVDAFILSGQLSQVKRWIMITDYAEMTVRMLRTLCKERNIREYYLMSKVELISELEQYDASRQSIRTSPHDETSCDI